MPRVKLFIKEIVIHETEVDMPDDLYQDYINDELCVDSYVADQMDDSTRKETYDFVDGIIEKVRT